MNMRMMPPPAVANQTCKVHKRTYSGVPGEVVIAPDFDGRVLVANGWTMISLSGPTSARPAGAISAYPAIPGTEFFDETLNKLIRFDGQSWRDPATGSAV